MRNRLLNFRPVKSTLRLVAPDLAKLEDALSEGRDFRIKPAPKPMEGADPRSSDIHAGRTGKTVLDEMAIDALQQRELLAETAAGRGAGDLDASLLSLYGAARTGIEETGANSLFLALGFLEWVDQEKSSNRHRAPILLVPVTLERKSVQSGYLLRRHDDEAIVNPTLLQMLRSVFELKVNGLDTVFADDKGVDVARILQAFREAVLPITDWEVTEDAFLGLFSFTKYLMWKDLQDRSADLMSNPVVQHLIERPGESFAVEAQTSDNRRLDASHGPAEIVAPLLADSSQLKAIIAVDAGANLVLEGPPGTGKSQTIANLIAHCLAKGRTVLFVSEKAAALSVVHKRLEAAGLGPFCLELHSAKARKSEVIQQLGKSLEARTATDTDEWARTGERLARQRIDLNAFVDTLHTVHRNGLSPFDAIGTCIAHGEDPISQLGWTDADAPDRTRLDALRELCRSMAAMAGAIGDLEAHPLEGIGHARWSPAWQDELQAAVREADTAIDALRDAAIGLGALLKISMQDAGIGRLALLDLLAESMLAATQVPVEFAARAGDERTMVLAAALAQHGLARQAHWRTIGTQWKPALLTRKAEDLASRLRQVARSWWPASIFRQRALTTSLTDARTDGRRPTLADIGEVISPLAACQDEEATLARMMPEVEALIGRRWNVVDSDWGALQSHVEWRQLLIERIVRITDGDIDLRGDLQPRLIAMAGSERALLEAQASAGRAFASLRDAWRHAQEAVGRCTALASPVVPIFGADDAERALENAQSTLARWTGASRLMQTWCAWRDVRERAIANGLQGIVSSVESGDTALDRVEAHFEHSYRSWWAKRIVSTEPVLSRFSSADHQRKIEEFRQTDAHYQRLTEQYLSTTLGARVPFSNGAAIGVESEVGRLRRELQKKTRHMPIRQLIGSLPTLLPRLKPCLLMSPLSVAQYLDAGHAPFDLVVFDEASQIPVWDAVGVIARGRQLVVVGDPKQLPPTTFFSRSGTEDDSDDAGHDVQELESILDECLGTGMKRMSLQWHYRSRHESLITFSNVRYYESRLVTFPSPVTDDTAVRFHHVEGAYDRGGSRTNRAEADAIVDAIEKHFLDPMQRLRSLGVVTFNQPQKELIETLLDARRRTGTALDRAIAERVDEALFIKNLENVQGDERDVILFSITYGPDQSGKVALAFGPLNIEGGQRRLNVAISRAREAIGIYSTLLPEMIDLARVRAAGVRDLRHYLAFAQQGVRALDGQPVSASNGPDSPLEEAVIDALRTQGWTAHPQVGSSAYRIDIGVVDPRSVGRYLLGIEFDGRNYHSGATARDRDRLRQRVLEGLGWQLHRIWSIDWWLNPADEIRKLTARLESALVRPTPELPIQHDPKQGSGPDAKTERSNGSADDGDAGDAGDSGVPGVPSAKTASSASNASNASSGDRPGLPPYSPTVLPRAPSDAFHDSRSAATLIAQIREVARLEGPIDEAETFRRIARAWGFERSGARIVARLQHLMPADLARTTEGATTWLWPPGADPSRLPACRVSDGSDGSARNVRDVCLAELAALLLHVLQEGGNAPPADAARTVCRLLGMARTPAEAEQRVALAHDWLVVLGKANRVDGLWSAAR